MRPSPFELWQQAGGDAGEYRRLLREHGHLVPGAPQPLPCGWPGHRADDDEDSRAGGTTPVAGPGPGMPALTAEPGQVPGIPGGDITRSPSVPPGTILPVPPACPGGTGPDGAAVEITPARPATEAAVPVGDRGTTPGGDADPQIQQPCPGHSSACPGQAEDAGPPPRPPGGGPAQAPVPGSRPGLPGAGITPDRADAPPPTHAALSGPGTAGAVRSNNAAPAAGLSGQDFRDKWKRVESAKNAGLRRGRSRGRQQQGYRPGSNQRGGGGDAA